MIDQSKNEEPGYEYVRSPVKITGLPVDTPGDDPRLLKVINKILVDKRPNAWDHERSGQRFHGAAVVRTKDGNFYTAANIHLQSPKTTRNCAEANATTMAFNEEGPKMEITDLWFMGGKSDLDNALQIVPGDEFRINSPCGSCLDVIWNNRLRSEGTGETRIHMLPLNNGEIDLIADDGSQFSYEKLEHRKQNQIITASIDELLAHRQLDLPDKDGATKQMIRHGWELIQDQGSVIAFNQALRNDALLTLGSMEKENHDPERIVDRVNELMVESLRDIFQKSSAQIKTAKAAVVRTDKGEYYLGLSFDNGKTLGIEPAEHDAIGEAVKIDPEARITDIFVMSIDTGKMPELLEKWQKEPEKDVTIDTPDGAARDRISKAGPRNGDKLKSLFGDELDRVRGANVHVITFNDIEHFDRRKHMLSLSMADLLPFRFTNPKMDEDPPAHACGAC